MPAGKLLTKENVLKFPAWADFVQRLPAGGDSLLHSDLCQLNLTFFFEQFMADVFLDHTEASLNCGREGGREGGRECYLDWGVLSDVGGEADRLLPGDALQHGILHRGPDLSNLMEKINLHKVRRNTVIMKSLTKSTQQCPLSGSKRQFLKSTPGGGVETTMGDKLS